MRTVSLSVPLLQVAATLALTAQFAYSQKITTFDVPNGIDTTPAAISPSGEFVGYYGNTTTMEVNGFIRKTNGAIISARFAQAWEPSHTVRLPGSVHQERRSGMNTRFCSKAKITVS